MVKKIKLTKLSNGLKQLPRKLLLFCKTQPKLAISLIFILGLLLLALAVYFIATDTSSNDNKLADQPTNAPQYNTILPDGKTSQQLGGWSRVSPPDEAPVYAYRDSLDGVKVKISQQLLPDSFKSNPADKVADLAQQFNATTKLHAGRTTAYLGTSAKGPQSVIFTKGDLLIFIMSSATVSDEVWIGYIKSLNNIYTRDLPKF